MNTIRQTKLVVYRLKREYGQPISILTQRSLTQSVTTGTITVDERVIKIRRAIILDSKSKRDFIYDLSFVAANKNFTMGGLFDTATRLVIIDGGDLPRDYTPTMNDRCMVEGQRYQIKSVNPTVQNLAFLIELSHLDAQKTENVTEVSLGQGVKME